MGTILPESATCQMRVVLVQKAPICRWCHSIRTLATFKIIAKKWRQVYTSREVLLPYLDEFFCVTTKKPLGAQHALSDKKNSLFFFKSHIDPISDGNCSYFEYFSVFFTVRNYTTNAAGDDGMVSVQVKNNWYQWPISASFSNVWQSMTVNLNKNFVSWIR